MASLGHHTADAKASVSNPLWAQNKKRLLLSNVFKA